MPSRQMTVISIAITLLLLLLLTHCVGDATFISDSPERSAISGHEGYHEAGHEEVTGERLSRVRRRLDPKGMKFDIAFIIDGPDSNEMKRKALQ